MGGFYFPPRQVSSTSRGWKPCTAAFGESRSCGKMGRATQAGGIPCPLLVSADKGEPVPRLLRLCSISPCRSALTQAARRRLAALGV